MKLREEESNYSVLKKTIEALKNGESVEDIIYSLKTFVSLKEINIVEDDLTIRARKGDNEAAKQLIKRLAAMNDGP